jgi:hypothetical protein
MKKILSILSLFLLSLTTVSAQNCDLPSSFEGNTGSNMTVMLLAPFINSLNVSSPDAYLVALNQDGTVIGSSVVFGVSQTTLAVWGDDSETTDVVDGAVANELVSFQLVDGTSLNDVTMPLEVVYAGNGLSVQSAPAVLTDACTYDSSGEAISYELSAGWNMVGYTGTADNNGIVAQMDAALGNDAGTAGTFQVIKNVSGQFWSAAFAQISDFTQGEGYMMFVNGTPTSVNFQKESGYISGIEYSLSAGWNMVAFTGDGNSDSNIVTAMNAALENGAGIANTFQVIKNVSGQFWSAAFAQISSFTPGEAYMMYVNGSPTLINFQQ